MDAIDFGYYITIYSEDNILKTRSLPRKNIYSL